MTFNEWWDTKYPPDTYAFTLRLRAKKLAAELAWDAAIDEAVSLVEKQFDCCEPWITPDEVRALKVGSSGTA